MSARQIGAALVALGLLQMGADALGLQALRALANATAASPAPKVFTRVRGSEPFSTRFTLSWIDTGGHARSLALTPERYARLRGPYNRRNAYAAVVAGGPALMDEPLMRRSVLSISRHALCGEAPVLRELGIDPSTIASPLRIHHVRRPGDNPRGLPDVIEVRCP